MLGGRPVKKGPPRGGRSEIGRGLLEPQEEHWVSREFPVAAVMTKSLQLCTMSQSEDATVGVTARPSCKLQPF